MIIRKNLWWVFYIKDGKVELNANKCGKWMYFFNDKVFVADVCKKAIEEDVVQVDKHSNKKEGVACFYIEYDDINAHKKLLQFMVNNGLIMRTKSGKLYNISFKLDNQTRAKKYGNNFKPKLKLSDFIDLYTGEWIFD